MKRKGGHLDPLVYTKKACKSSNFFIWVYLSGSLLKLEELQIYIIDNT